MSEKPDNVVYGFAERRAKQVAAEREATESQERESITLLEVARNIVLHVDHALMLSEVIAKKEAEDRLLYMAATPLSLSEAEELLKEKLTFQTRMLATTGLPAIEKLLKDHQADPEHLNKVYLHAIAKRYLELMENPSTAA